MWQLWTAGFWSVLVALLPFLGFPPDALQVMEIASGIGIAVLVFWALARKRTE